MLRFTGWEHAEDAKRIAIVFENRNKNYGAYVLRVHYYKRLNKALFFSAVCFLIIALLPFITEWASGKMNKEIKPLKEIVVNLTEPPPIDEMPPPPPPPPPQQVRETVKFTPPKVVDKPVDEEPPPQEKLSETTVSTITQEGEKEIDLPPEPIVDRDEGKIFTIVDEMPVFPGGKEKLYEFLRTNIRYPAAAREYLVHGKVILSFIIDRNGKISDAKIMKGIGSGCDEEALRVINKMPDWIPGKQNGRPVMVSYYLPVEFYLK
jgi:protein TonB